MSEWKTQRYEGSVGVDGRWVVSRSEAESRIDYYRKFAHERHEQYMECQATLAAVREALDRWDQSSDQLSPDGYGVIDAIRAILDGEGENCPTCGGTDRDGGTVATSGPDEFGNYDTDDCPDPWHEAKSTERKPGPLHG